MADRSSSSSAAAAADAAAGAETLSRNDPLQEFLREQKDALSAGTLTHDEFMSAYETHVAASTQQQQQQQQQQSVPDDSDSVSQGGGATVVVAHSPGTGRGSGGGGGGGGGGRGSGSGDDALHNVFFDAEDDSPYRQARGTSNLKSIVLKFTTLSDACTEAPSFNVGTMGATIGRDESNEVSVPSDTHLVANGHASLEYVDGVFFLVDGGFDYPASIRVGASGSKRSTWRLLPDTRFTAGSSIFHAHGLNENGDLLLDIIDGPLKGENREVKKETGATIGRASDNSLSVPDRELSRKHSLIEFDAKLGKFVLVDLDSTNGTYMQLVGPYGGRYKLSLNDHILVGRTGFSINRYDYGLSEEMGHRLTMEDACAIVQHLSIAPLSSVPAAQQCFSPQSFFGVYDGHGGTEASAYLSQHLHVNVTDAVLGISQQLVAESSAVAQGDEAARARVDALVIKALKDSFLATDATFLSASTPAHAQHGSTATTGLLLGQRLYCANVGDSRTLLCRNFQPLPMSTDHKPNRPDESERIRSAGGFVFNNRVMGELAVSRAFGDSALKMGITPTLIEQAGMTVETNAEENIQNWDQPLVIAEPDVEVTTITENDQFFLLACDGLFDVFTPEDVIAFVRANMEEHGDAQRCCQNLTYEAIRKRNSRDNVSVILIILKKWWF